MESRRDEVDHFNVMIRKEGDTFVLYSREWNLLVQESDLNRAYEQFQIEQKSIVERYRKARLEHELPGYRTKGAMVLFDRIFGRNVLTLVLRTTIVGAILGVFILLGSLIFIDQQIRLAHQVKKMTSPSPGLVGKIATGMMEKIAQSLEELTPERRESIRRSLQTIVRESEPFRRELSASSGETSNSTLKRHP